jgi:hypothetical protein
MRSEIVLAFDRAECNDAGFQPYRLVLEAIGAPAEVGGELTADLPDPATMGLRTVQLHPAVQHIDLLPELRPGEVHGFIGLRLTARPGPEPTTVLTNRSNDVCLELHSRLLLRPAAQIASEVATPGPKAAEVFLEQPPVSVVEPEGPEAEQCAPPECSTAVALPDGAQDYTGTIPLHDLGYVARANREIYAPSDDEALAWLSPTELLVTFNPHPLVPRYSQQSSHQTVRVIRAVLIDTMKHKVMHTADWQLPDHGQFLWQLPSNRVLVHAGNEVTIYRAGMQIEKRIRLAGPLGFARVSPDGKLIAMGVIKERHSSELHAKLEDQMGQDPMEDMQVLLMNDRLETIGSVLANSDRIPPILLNEGEVSLYVSAGQENRPQKRYVLQLREWDHTSRTLGHFSSTCVPQVSSLPPDLLFLVTCDRFSGAREYRVLRADGRPVLHGKSYLTELGHAAAAGGTPGTFALRILTTDVPTVPGEPFHPGDLESAQLIIYRCQDGKRLFSVRVKDPAASSGGYAISPSGEVAILTRDDVDVYRVPRK